MTGAGPIGAFGACTKMRGKELPGKISGIIPVLGSLALAIGYTVVVGWIFKYTFVSITGQLSSLGSTPGELGATFDQIAATSPSFGESVKAIFTGKIGNTLWLIIGLVVSIVIMIFGIGGGIEKVNKFMMPTLFVLLIGLGIYIACLPGAGEGYKYIFAMKSEMLLDPELWVFAFGQAFFSLSVAGNGSVIYGSYLPKDDDLVFSSRNIALFDTMAALLAAFVIIPAMTAGNGDPTQGGPGLMFIALIQVFNNMPGGAFVGAIFFICVLFAGLSSLVNLYEAPVASLQEIFHMKRLPACLIVGGIGCLVAVIIQGITGGWMDMVSVYICPLGALIAGIMFFWVCHKDKAMEAMGEGRKKPLGTWVYYMGKYVYVALALIALVAGIVVYFVKHTTIG